MRNTVLTQTCALFTASALLAATPAFAAPIVPGTSGTSYTYDAANKTYFVSGNTLLNADISGTDLYVGKSNVSPYSTLGGTATLTVGAGAVATRTVPNVDLAGYGINTYGAFHTNVSGGNIANLFGEDASVTTITGGAINLAVLFNSASLSLSGGAVTFLALGEAGTAEVTTAAISGGVFTNLTLTANSTATITGGIVPTVDGSGVYLYDTGARANLYGNGLAATYIGLNANGYDVFNVTGTLNDGTVYTPSAPLPVGIRSTTNVPNSTPRQFSLNNPAVVPEAGTLAFATIGLAGGAGLARRKRK